jgi:hypothetical protein
MDYSVVIIIAIVIAGVGGFAVLAYTLLDNWGSRSRGHEESDAYQSRRSSEFKGQICRQRGEVEETTEQPHPLPDVSKEVGLDRMHQENHP